MPYLRTIPLAGEALERYHFNRLQIRMEEHIIEGNDAYLYHDDDADYYDDEDDDHNEKEHDNNKTVGYLSDTILDEVLVGYCTPDELERDPVSSIKWKRPNHDVHEQRGVTRRSEERNSQDIVSFVNMKKRSKNHYEHDHDHKCQPKELLCDVTKPRPDVTIPAGELNCDSLDEHKEEDTALYLTPMDATFKEGFEINPSIGNNHTDDSCTKNRNVSISRGSKRLSFDARYEDELINYEKRHGQFSAPPRGEDKFLASNRQHARFCNHEDRGGEDKFLASTRQNVRPYKKGSIQILARARSSYSRYYEELIQFKAKYGHCVVSQGGSGEFKSLARWCSKVRTSFRLMNGHHKGRIPIKLSKNQMQELTELGFNWLVLPKKPNGHVSLFDIRYEGLRQYKAKYGHCDVSIADGSGEFMILGNWCKKVRKYRDLMEDRLKGPMPRYKLSQKQMQQLTELGFDWNWMGPLKRIKRKTVKRKTVKHKTFSGRFKDLRQYKAKYGHCDVSTTGEFKSLAGWCSKVKTSRKIIEGRLKGSTPLVKLSQMQIQQLTELGFKWVAGNRYKVVSRDLPP